MVITIDGPAGSGKSTVARRLAKALGMACLDTGATYRAVTLKALDQGADLEDESALTRIAEEIDLKLVATPDGVRTIIDGVDSSAAIRSEAVSDSVHYVARSEGVRRLLVRLQRRMGAELGDFVTEGRDQGSVVFPEADVKFFLDAPPPVRARRRCRELRDRGEQADYDEILAAIRRRDQRDRSRSSGPLIKPDDAIEIDTGDKSIDQVVAELLRHVETTR